MSENANHATSEDETFIEPGGEAAEAAMPTAVESGAGDEPVPTDEPAPVAPEEATADVSDPTPQTESTDDVTPEEGIIEQAAAIDAASEPVTEPADEDASEPATAPEAVAADAQTPKPAPPSPR
ncbi:hypothetical protein N867_05930, partial [Actinotalea fermentans ATCC 43279 = JCM 9966 = DSM 3133]